MILRLESIGHDRTMGPVNMRGRSPWVAEITGLCDEYGLERRFLRGKADFSEANGAGSRGVYMVFALESPAVYEVNNLISWGRADRYFFKVSGGIGREVGRPEVLAWLAGEYP